VAIRLDAMLQAVELPAGIANLATGLADVDRDALTLGRRNKLDFYANYHQIHMQTQNYSHERGKYCSRKIPRKYGQEKKWEIFVTLRTVPTKWSGTA